MTETIECKPLLNDRAAIAAAVRGVDAAYHAASCHHCFGAIVSPCGNFDAPCNTCEALDHDISTAETHLLQVKGLQWGIPRAYDRKPDGSAWPFTKWLGDRITVVVRDIERESQYPDDEFDNDLPF